jgi:cardiolipin synthase
MPSSASRLPLLACCWLTASCAISSNARRSTEQAPQANNPVVGGASLAMTALRSTAVATIKEPITTARLGFALLWTRPHEALVANLPVELPLDPQAKEIPGSPEFEKLLDRKHFPLAQKGSVKWLVDGSQFFPELDRHIAAAKKSVDIQVFIFDNDDIATRYADVLKARSKEVKVHVLFDDLGSTFAQLSPPDTPGPIGFTAPINMARYLEDHSKVRARRILNPWLASDHTKLLVFDQQCAMLGGMNIGREYYSEWHDLMGCVEGPIVTTLAKDFNRSWHKAGPWGDFATLVRSPGFLRRNKAAPDDISIRPFRTDPSVGQYDVLKSYLLGIRSARKRIWIENPYIAHDELIRALSGAARRGVDVRVILPAHGDSGIMDIANISTERTLIQAGAKIYRYPRMTHMKVMLCDGWGTMGSANMDTLSMRINRELNIAFRSAASISALEKQVFLPDFKTSKLIKLSDTESSIAPLAEMVADQL